MAVVMAVFIGVVFVFAKKDNKECDELVSKLTEEQKNILMSTDVNFVEERAWIQNAIVSKFKDKGNKVALRLLWFNKIIKNNVIYSYTNEKGERKQKWETYETKKTTFAH